jgi:biopolymer transport protein ExbD
MSSKKKKSFVSPGGRPNSDINVTPLVDVVLVLLIIFMVVTPLLEKDIEVRVPDNEEVKTDPQDVPPDQLVVQLNEQGQITINTHPVAGKDYVDELKKILAGKKSDDKLVFFMADDKTNYGLLVQALDGARQAGADPLGMMTEPLEAAAPAPGGAPAPDAPKP